MAVNKPDPHRFTADEYHKMGEAGILGDDDEVELVDGEILEVSADGGEHAAAAAARIAATLSAAIGDRATVTEAAPIKVGASSEPVPDVCVTLARPGAGVEHRPRPEEVLLLVEVSDTSVAFDDEVKGPLYANAGVIETWIVDVPAGVVVVSRDPQRCGYMDKRRLTAGETIVPLMLPGATIAVSDLI